jgi:hypothetical protein
LQNDLPGLEAEAQPVGIKEHLAAEGDKDDQQDKTAPAARAGCPSPKTKAVLEPIKKHIQHKQFK